MVKAMREQEKQTLVHVNGKHVSTTPTQNRITHLKFHGKHNDKRHKRTTECIMAQPITLKMKIKNADENPCKNKQAWPVPLADKAEDRLFKCRHHHAEWIRHDCIIPPCLPRNLPITESNIHNCGKRNKTHPNLEIFSYFRNKRNVR